MVGWPIPFLTQPHQMSTLGLRLLVVVGSSLKSYSQGTADRSIKGR